MKATPHRSICSTTSHAKRGVPAGKEKEKGDMAAVKDARQRVGTAAARPAEPLLASSLIDVEVLDAVFEQLNIEAASAVPSSKPEILQTGVKSLDDALDTVLQGGRVVALTSETSSERDDLAKTLLIDCLVRQRESLVAVIDTTGNFDVVGLYTRILKRLEKEAGDVHSREGAIGAHEATRREDVAAKVLDRVKIMRVFDFVGVKEAVDELRDGLEGRVVEGESTEKVITHVHSMEEEKPAPKKREEVADSEDEDEELEVSDEEMLFDVEAPPTDQTQVLASKQEPPLRIDAQAKQHTTQDPQALPKLKLILIDNLAHVLTPLLKKDTLSGNSLATTFLTTLLHLTHAHALHTILLNPSSTPRTRSPTRQPPSTTTPLQQPTPAPQQSYAPQPPPPPSIFSSNATVPALMGLLGRYADAHVLVSRMPRRKMDAKVFYAETGGRERGKRRGVEMVGVLEVIADRWGSRVGAWGVFGEKT